MKNHAFLIGLSSLLLPVAGCPLGHGDGSTTTAAEGDDAKTPASADDSFDEADEPTPLSQDDRCASPGPRPMPSLTWATGGAGASQPVVPSPTPTAP